MRLNYLLLSSILFLLLNTECTSAFSQIVKSTSDPVKVLYFGADPLTFPTPASASLLTVVENITNSTIPAGALRLRCIALSGLDYTSGELAPLLPALNPGQYAVCRWNLAPSGKGPASAALMIETVLNRTWLSVQTTGLPIENHPLRFGDPLPGVDKSPRVLLGINSAWLSGNRIAIHIKRTSQDMPILILAGRNGKRWQMAGLCMPLMKTLSGEPGQQAWWQTFHWLTTNEYSDSSMAELTLIGTLGRFWKAKISFTARQNTAAINGHIHLTALRTLQLSSLQMPRLMVLLSGMPLPPANGIPILLPADPPADPLPDSAPVAAFHFGHITSGMSWSASSLLPGWSSDQIPDCPAGASLHGVRINTNQSNSLIVAGESISFPFRLFAVDPSSSLQDALHFAPH